MVHNMTIKAGESESEAVKLDFEGPAATYLPDNWQTTDLLWLGSFDGLRWGEVRFEGEYIMGPECFRKDVVTWNPARFRGVTWVRLVSRVPQPESCAVRLVTVPLGPAS